MSEKDRDEITGMLTQRGIEDLGAPWLSMAQGQPQAYLPPLQPYVAPPPSIPVGRDNDSGPLSLEGSVKGSAGSIDKMRRISPDVDTRLRYRRGF
jgi:hypothetical protein